MKKTWITMCGVLAVAGATLAAMTIQARADRRACGFQRFALDGFQASNASTLVLEGSDIGQGATWSHLYGPVIGNTVGEVPPSGQAAQAPSFGGAGCQLEYSQDQLSANGGRDTFVADVYSLSCQPFNQAGVALRNGTFNIVSGTGLYQNLTGGGGSIQISSRADGSAILHLSGSLIGRGDSYRQF